jgi:SAM-dependent methyltransferase
MKEFGCRFCGHPLRHSFVDLGMSPLANSYVEPDALQRMEPFFPLHVWVCERCLLVQLPETESPEAIFSDYAYFSSYSTSWLRHAESYVAAMVERFGFDRESQIVEIASNDGYLLQYFQRRGIPVLGIEPAGNVAQAAQERGIRTLVKFFNSKTATELVDEGLAADLLLGNNVLAHVPGLNDFVEGLKIALKPGGVVTMEFPHLMRLMAENQFDTIYHEHFSYFSFRPVRRRGASHPRRLHPYLCPSHRGRIQTGGAACHRAAGPGAGRGVRRPRSLSDLWRTGKRDQAQIAELSRPSQKRR